MAKKPVKPQPAGKQKKSSGQPSFWSNTKLLGAIVAIIAFMVFANTLGHQYALDDVAVIYQNKFVQKGFAGIPDIMTTFYWQGYWEQNAGLYRPLSLIMFAMEWEFFPNQPFIGHFMNILLFALTCYLLFKVLLRLFPQLPPV